MYKSKHNKPIAALAAALATLGSTTEARNATVDMMGLPDLEKGTGWYTNGPVEEWLFIIENNSMEIELNQ